MESMYTIVETVLPASWIESVTTADPKAIAMSLLVIVGFAFTAIPPLVPLMKWTLSMGRLKFVLWRHNNKNGSSNDTYNAASVSGMYIHPLKSGRSRVVYETELDEKRGTLMDDRRFMVVFQLPPPSSSSRSSKQSTATHRFLTQRECPSLARVQAKIVTKVVRRVDTETELLLDYTSSDGATKSIRVLLSSTSNTVEGTTSHETQQQPQRQRLLAQIWDDIVAVDDLGDEAATFFQDIVDEDEVKSGGGDDTKLVRIVQASTTPPLAPIPKDYRKYVPSYCKTPQGLYLGKPTLTDGFPILIASEASLEYLNQQLVANGRDEIPMSRFRPNIVIRGKNLKPFEEDKWKIVKIGSVYFAIVKACPRCKQSCTDQTTGIVDKHMEPLKTMSTFRKSKENKDKKAGSVFFAQNAFPIGDYQGKTIKLGDPIQIVERGDLVFID